jgi:CheY-like chemotaxis protein
MLLVACGDSRRRENFVSALVEAGWQMTASVASLSEAASLVRDGLNVCVVVDAELADVQGLAAVPILRKLCPRARIIFTAPENTRELEAQVRALDVFYYYISSADRAELVAAVEEALGSPRASTPPKPPKVLIVDDDPDFHDIVRAILEPAGYCTVSAYSEQEGLDRARREKPDAILLDIIMGSSTAGFEFCREARRDPQIKHTPIVGISAIEQRIGLHHPPGPDPEFFPVDGYLRKPVAPELLFAELRKLLSAGN